METHPSHPDDYIVIFVRYITVKGRRIYASSYGKEAFPIRVKKKR